MSAPESLYGQRDADGYESIAHEVAASKDSLTLNDVEISYSLFEIPMLQAQRALPRSLHPSVPAVLATNFWRVPDSPWGEFRWGYLGIACRTGIKPRHYTVRAWCDNHNAAEFLRDSYGVDCRPAELYQRESYDQVRASVTENDTTVLDVVTTNMLSIASVGASVKYSPSLNVARVSSTPKMIQFESAFQFKRVLRGEVAAETFDELNLAAPNLTPAYSIAGTFAQCDVELLPARFKLDIVTPAEAGGAERL